MRGPLRPTPRRACISATDPAPDARAIDARSRARCARVREIVSLGLQVRTTSKLRVRQPLAAAEIVLADPALEPALREHAALMRDELNVHEVHFARAPTTTSATR